MSKLNLELSYKNACILKHSLRDKVEATKIFLEGPAVVNLTKAELEKLEKEHEEEKRALASTEKEMIRATECHGQSWYRPTTINKISKCKICGGKLIYDSNGSAAPDSKEWLECEKCGRFYDIDGNISDGK